MGAQGFSLPTGSANQTLCLCVCVFVDAQVQSEPDDSTLVPALRMNKRPSSLNVRTRCTPTGVWEKCAPTLKLSAIFKHSAAAIVSAFYSHLCLVSPGDQRGVEHPDTLTAAGNLAPVCP